MTTCYGVNHGVDSVAVTVMVRYRNLMHSAPF